MDRKAVFGLNAVQSFFAVILGIALLSYVIVVIMGSLSESTVLTPTTGSEVEMILQNSNIPITLANTTTGASITSMVARGNNQTWLEFDGDTDLINISDQDYYSPALSNFSVCLWANKSQNTSTRLYYISKGDTNNYEWQITLETNELVRASLLQSDGSDSAVADSSTFSEEGKFQHICFVNNNETYLDLFLNGDFSANDITYVGDISNGVSDVQVGLRRGFQGDWNGSIDDIRIYNEILSPASIANIYVTSNRNDENKYIPVILLHDFVDRAPQDNTYEINYTSFIELLNFLNDSNYSTITDYDLLNYSLGNIVLPDKPIIISWDDDYIDEWVNASLIMNNYSYKSVVYIRTNISFISDSDWGNLSLLINDSNWSIGSHSVTHCNFVSGCDNISEWQKEFSNSKADIIGNLSYTPIGFSYPGSSWNSSTQESCSKNYSICFGDTTEKPNLHRSEFVFRNTNRTNGRYERIGHTNDTSIGELNIVLNYSYGLNNIVSRFNLNENTGTTAYDSSPNGNNGTITGATYQTDGVTTTLTNNVDYNYSNTLFEILNSEHAFSQINLAYNWQNPTTYQDDLDTVLSNTSTGITGFFSSINPIYAILAVLVIILVLVVLVRVVQNPKSNYQL